MGIRTRRNAHAEAGRRLFNAKYEEAKAHGHDWQCANAYAESGRVGVVGWRGCICQAQVVVR
jgi:hypothetical protein